MYPFLLHSSASFWLSAAITKVSNNVQFIKYTSLTLKLLCTTEQNIIVPVSHVRDLTHTCSERCGFWMSAVEDMKFK